MATRIDRYSDEPTSGRCRPERDTDPVDRPLLPRASDEDLAAHRLQGEFRKDERARAQVLLLGTSLSCLPSR